MKTLILGFCTICCAIAGFGDTWRYVAADAADNQHEGVPYITDGNWAIKVAEWNATTFKTVKGSGYLAGSGAMDLTDVNTDLGKTWVFEGSWVGFYSGPFAAFTTLTEIVLPETCTSLCYGMFRGCSNLTKITIPSGFLTSMGAGAVNGCGKLSTVVPESAFSGSCSSYGEACFTDCYSLRIPFKWELEGNISCGSAPFVRTVITEFDLSEVQGTSIALKGYNNSATNVIWGPNALNFLTSDFCTASTFYFPGILPAESTYKAPAQRTIRFFCDPMMDPNWNGDTIMGMTITRPEEADFATYAAKFNVSEEEAAASVLGWYPVDTWTGNRLWLVKYKSPFNSGRLSLTASPLRPESGTVTCSPAANDYEEGDRVTVTAVPAEDYVFFCWRGQLPEDIDIHSPSVSFEMTSNYKMFAVMTNRLGWTHREATETEPELITDGNWAFKVSEWNDNATTFTTVRGVDGHISGEGVLDLRNSTAQLGRRWVFDGSWNNNYTTYYGTFAFNKQLKEVILPQDCTSLCYGMFRGCSELTKITIPSGFLTSMGDGAVNGCSKLSTVVPETAFSGTCASYGESCFVGCTSLKSPFVWELEGDIVCGWMSFVGTVIPEFDFSGVKGTSIAMTGSGNSATNVIWGPNALNFPASNFCTASTFYFPGILPSEAIYTPDAARSVRFFCDPSMDESWRDDTIMGITLTRPESADFEAYATAFGVSAAEASKSVLGWYSDDGGTIKNLWLVKWRSPFREVVGTVLLVR